MSALREQDRVDIEDILWEMQHLVGPEIDVQVSYEVMNARNISARDGTRWVYLSRIES